MVLGDGIRRNVATISQEERDRLINAFIKLDTTKLYPDGVSYWDKQEDIHKEAHAAGQDVHDGPAFLPWHRELINRLEALLREVDPQLSLHYWDWTTDPRPELFTPQFMGSPTPPSAGAPLQNFESTEPGHTLIWRDVNGGNPGAPPVALDNAIITSADGSPDAMQFQIFRSPNLPNGLQRAHNISHGYIGGTILLQHFSFHDPFVFLLHSNVDRLWAMWQRAPGKEWRLDPNLTYGVEGTSSSISEDLQPWAGTSPPLLRPWAPPDNQQLVKNCKDPSIVIPHCYDTLPITIDVVNQGSIINFNDVPEGETTIRAAVFKTYSCGDLNLEIKPGSGPSAPYSVFMPPGSTVIHHADNTSFVEGRIWLAFTGTAAGTTAPDGSVTIRCIETGQEFPLTLKGNTIARPTMAVVLTLDQSGSMDDPAGSTGIKRIQVLHEAASRFAELAQANNGIGVVSFDQGAYLRLPVTKIGPSALDPNRATILQAITNHKTNPLGTTSIGNGVELAHNTLAPVMGFDHKANIVFTDGLENTPKFIADVKGSIDERTFAIGLGSAEQVSTAALNALTQGTGGYLLLTDLLSASTEDYFLASKYFLQILAGVTNSNIVVDPSGVITSGMQLSIPFVLNEADIYATVILLTDNPIVRLRVKTPDGQIIDPIVAAGFGGTYVVGTNMVYYRFLLPVPLGPGAHAGTWEALLDIQDVIITSPRAGSEKASAASAVSRGRSARYSLQVQSYSNLRMNARLYQNSLQPGATMVLRTILTEYGQSVQNRAMVKADLLRPDKTSIALYLPEVEPGIFETSLTAAIPGIYRFHVKASGASMRGFPFTCEQILTGAVFQGGDDPLPTSLNGRDDCLCRLLDCLISEKAFGKYLEKKGIDCGILMRCLKKYHESHQISEPRMPAPGNHHELNCR